MTNSTDQEREAFEVALIAMHVSTGVPKDDAQIFLEQGSNGYTSLLTKGAWWAWQARAAVQPASVAVPKGWTVKTVEPEDGFGFIIQTPRINGVSSGTSVWSESENPAEIMLALMLAGAPHPVSGEQEPITAPYLMYCLGSWWPCEERQVNAAVDRNYPLINLRGLPAAQDLAALVEALEQFANDDNWCYDTCNISRDIAKDALAAHRAQQREQT